MVAIGTFISATWILSVNSWMQTPQGFSIDAVSGQFLPEDWFTIIFNPSFPYRLAHTLTAAYLTTALAVGGVGAWHLLRGRKDNEGVRTILTAFIVIYFVVFGAGVFYLLRLMNTEPKLDESGEASLYFPCLPMSFSMDSIWGQACFLSCIQNVMTGT